MKTLKLIAMFLVIFTVALVAQHTEGAFEKISQKEVPETILAALENDFSGAEVIAYYVLAVDLYEDHWSAKQTKEDLEKGGDLHHYLVEFDANAKYNKVVYDAQGVLMQRREVIKDAQLPLVIIDYINSKYEGYTITKDKELVKTSKDGTEDHYKIKIEKDKFVKSLYFNGKGELLKESKN